MLTTTLTIVGTGLALAVLVLMSASSILPELAEAAREDRRGRRLRHGPDPDE